MPDGYILVTGGAGFIASHLMEEFPADNYIIVDNDPQKIRFPDETSILADIRKEDEFRQVFEKYPIKTIIHLAAAHRDFGIEPLEYYSTNVTGTEIVCKLATEFKVREIIFYSSVAVYGDTETPTNDHSVPNPSNDYGKTKLQAEEVLGKWHEEDPDRLLIIMRPALVYGERNIANMYRLIDQIAKGLYFNVGKGENVKSIAYVKNLVNATQFLLGELESGKHIFNYSDQPHLPIADLSEEIAKALGKSKPIHIPKPLLILAAWPFDMVTKLTGKDLPVSSNRVKKLATQTYHRAQTIFETGFTPAYLPVDGLKRMVKWYQEVNKNKA